MGLDEQREGRGLLELDVTAPSWLAIYTRGGICFSLREMGALKQLETFRLTSAVHFEEHGAAALRFLKTACAASLFTLTIKVDNYIQLFDFGDVPEEGTLLPEQFPHLRSLTLDLSSASPTRKHHLGRTWALLSSPSLSHLYLHFPSFYFLPPTILESIPDLRRSWATLESLTLISKPLSTRLLDIASTLHLPLPRLVTLCLKGALFTPSHLALFASINAPHLETVDLTEMLLAPGCDPVVHFPAMEAVKSFDVTGPTPSVNPSYRVGDRWARIGAQDEGAADRAPHGARTLVGYGAGGARTGAESCGRGGGGGTRGGKDGGGGI